MIVSSALLEMMLKHRDDLARTAVRKAIERSREHARFVKPRPDAATVSGWVRINAVQSLLEQDHLSHTRRRAVFGAVPGHSFDPISQWTLHVDRVLWADAKVSF